MIINRDNFRIEIQIKSVDGGIRVSTFPIVHEGNDTVEEDILETDVLRGLIYGVSTFIREVEDNNSEEVPKGKLMGQVIESLNKLYINPDVVDWKSKESEGVGGKGITSTSQQEPGNELSDWEPPH